MPSSQISDEERVSLLFWAERYAESGNPQAKIAIRLLAENKELQREIEIDNFLLANHNRILEELPCPDHGKCVPHVIAFIQKAKVLIAALTRIIARSKGSEGEPSLSPVEAQLVDTAARAGNLELPE